jgi:uncharacterized Zn-binding protein involved in type VI secretion
MTATGDVITGPGVPNVLIEGMPASVMGDLVNGAACVGSIVMGSPTVLVSGRPLARVTSSVVGANPATGVPVSTTIAKGALRTMVP